MSLSAAKRILKHRLLHNVFMHLTDMSVIDYNDNGFTLFTERSRAATLFDR